MSQDRSLNPKFVSGCIWVTLIPLRQEQMSMGSLTLIPSFEGGNLDRGSEKCWQLLGGVLRSRALGLSELGQ